MLITITNSYHHEQSVPCIQRHLISVPSPSPRRGRASQPPQAVEFHHPQWQIRIPTGKKRAEKGLEEIISHHSGDAEIDVDLCWPVELGRLNLDGVIALPCFVMMLDAMM